MDQVEVNKVFDLALVIKNSKYYTSALWQEPCIQVLCGVRFVGVNHHTTRPNSKPLVYLKHNVNTLIYTSFNSSSRLLFCQVKKISSSVNLTHYHFQVQVHPSQCLSIAIKLSQNNCKVSSSQVFNFQRLFMDVFNHTPLHSYHFSSNTLMPSRLIHNPTKFPTLQQI